MGVDQINANGSGQDIAVDSSIEGLDYGAVAGYRMKSDRIVFGIEANFSFSNADGTILSYNDGVDTYTLNAEKKRSYAIGPRVGYLVTDSALAFVGIDWVNTKYEANLLVNGASVGSISDTESAFRYGGGIEAAATQNISVRLDYMHTNWGDQSATDAGGGTATDDVDEDTARVSLIYSF